MEREVFVDGILEKIGYERGLSAAWLAQNGAGCAHRSRHNIPSGRIGRPPLRKQAPKGFLLRHAVLLVPKSK